jgi:hypothetical protein
MRDAQARQQRLYQLLDEPHPGRLEHLVVHPMWPLLGLMLGGMWLALPWFVLNGIAVGSSTRVKEIALAAGGLVATAVTIFILIALAGGGYLEGTTIYYALLSLTIIKLGTGYLLYSIQQRSVALFEYYGGTVRNGLLLVIAATFVSGKVLGLVPWPVVRLILQ